MMLYKEMKQNAGSNVAQNKNVRVPADNLQSPAGSKNKLGSIEFRNQTKILSLNIEGSSMPKCEYLGKILQQHRVDIALLQETHATATSPESKTRIPGYTLISKVCHDKYGICTYARNPSEVTELQSVLTSNNTHRSAVKIKELTVVNLYKPPNKEWPNPPLPSFPHPTVYIGDFNSHNTDWGYNENDKAGEQLGQWINDTNLHLLYDPKTHGTFHSSRWNKDYSTDLCLVSKNDNLDPLPASTEILPSFPHSQHRPIITTVGLKIPIINSLPKNRWNFEQANWENFAKAVDQTCIHIPPSAQTIPRFHKLVLKSARRYIPRGRRKKYVPCWSKESEALFKAYEETNDNNTADQLLSSLNKDRRNRWISTVENLDFKHSSRKAWALLHKLDLNSTSKPKTAAPISANQIAKEIKQRGHHKPNHTFEKSVRKEYQQLYRTYTEDSNLSSHILMSELKESLKQTKASKAAGIDGIYPEMLKHLGNNSLQWLRTALTDIIQTGKLPKDWKIAKVIAILKPGKDPTNPSSYRPISLLCCTYKVLERIILARITPLVEPFLPSEQSGFRKHRCTSEQVLALTSHIETGYELKNTTGAIFVDLSAAYDTVWHDGLLLKLAKIIKCRTMLRIISKMTGTRRFYTCVGSDTSKTFKIKNGVPQGSVLAPTLFNVYIRDMPKTKCLKFGYADDWALTYQGNCLTTIQNQLTADLTTLQEYFTTWYLQMNTTKTVTTLFHLDNHRANQQLNITIDGKQLPTDPNPKYLGITLDRTLNYRQHLEKLSNKIKTRNSLINKLAATRWGASQSVLRTSALALCYSAAEYCASTWERSTHTKKLDIQLNRTMRIISGTLKSTPITWLPTMSAIPPPHLRRRASAMKMIQNLQTLPEEIPLTKIIRQAPKTRRLKSRHPIYNLETDNTFDMTEKWKQYWFNNMPAGGELVDDPTTPLPGFDLAHRRNWVAANRLRSKHARTAHMLQRWGERTSSECPHCGADKQDTDHLVLKCPTTKLQGGYRTVHECDTAFSDWFQNISDHI
uniref:Reverse transcriptase n=1 Tax=Phallusia mammillata TaxID=59560 RepID=A0A6F9DUY6_9ASCI|nr:reverse transcriptase [Phallusia mammillata]